MLQRRKLNEIDASSFEADITGTLDKQVVLRIGSKKRIVFCGATDILEKIEASCPIHAHVKLLGEDLVSFEETNE